MAGRTHANGHGRAFATAGAIFKAFAQYSGARGWRAGGYVLIAALFECAWLVTIVPLLNVVFAADKTDSILARMFSHGLAVLGCASAVSRMCVLLGLLGVVMLGRAVAMARRDVLLVALRCGFVEHLRGRIALCLATARWDRVVALQHARITHVLGSDVQNLGNATSFLMQCIVAITMLLAQCLLAISLAPQLALFCFVLMAGVAVALIPFLRRAQRLGSYLARTNLGLMNGTSQYLGGLKLAVSQNLQERFVVAFRSQLRAISDHQIAYAKQNAAKNLAVTATASLLGAMLVLSGFAWFHVPGTVLTALLLVVLRMNGQFAALQQGAQQVAALLPVYETIQTLEADLTSPPTSSGEASTGRAGALPQSEFRVDGPIVFRDVSFVYPVGRGSKAWSGVRELNFRIEPGTFVGVCGASGAGKTTFADLLVGLFPPQQGTIAVGDTVLGPDTAPLWRDRLAYVSQDPYLMNDTIRNNLLWSCSEADEAQMWAALRFAEAESLVRAMPRGMDTMAGERGNLMSGGERQRIALARALLRKPALLVLDEATNAIDIGTETRIIGRIAALQPRPTVVMITHRREAVVQCDRVLEFTAGIATCLR